MWGCAPCSVVSQSGQGAATPPPPLWVPGSPQGAPWTVLRLLASSATVACDPREENHGQAELFLGPFVLCFPHFFFWQIDLGKGEVWFREKQL